MAKSSRSRAALSSILTLAAAARERGIGFLAVFFPQRFQVQLDDWAATVRSYGLAAAAALLPAVRSKVPPPSP